MSLGQQFNIFGLLISWAAKFIDGSSILYVLKISTERKRECAISRYGVTGPSPTRCVPPRKSKLSSPLVCFCLTWQAKVTKFTYARLGLSYFWVRIYWCEHNLMQHCNILNSEDVVKLKIIIKAVSEYSLKFD